MTMKLAAVVVAAVIAVAAFGAGYRVGGNGALHVPIYVADGYVGGDAASFQVGDTWYAFESAVEWTDRTGMVHSQSWPDCLPKLQEVKGVRIAAGMLFIGDTGNGIGQVVWVDCQNR